MDSETMVALDDLESLIEADDEELLALGRTSTNDPTAC